MARSSRRVTLQARNGTIANQLQVFKAGNDTDPKDPLLNPASVLLGGHICPDNQRLAEGFLTWMVAADGGQAIVRDYQQSGVPGRLYTPAPNCTLERVHCEGW